MQMAPSSFSGESFQSLVIDGDVKRSQFAAVVDAVNASGLQYHRMDFGNGIVISGIFDIAKHLEWYDLPASLEGKRVLDIGAATGFFALECARRGAKVTAVELYATPLPKLLPFLRADIDIVAKSVYELDASIGTFDLVICGSLLLHLPDVFGAIQKIRDVCRGHAVISTLCTHDSRTNDRAICDFIGERAVDADYYTYWSVSAAALRRMLFTAGFSSVERERHFVLRSEPSYREMLVAHVVMTAST